MATIVLDVQDITKTAGYKEAMDDIKHGRVTEYASLKDFYKEMGLFPQTGTHADIFGW